MSLYIRGRNYFEVIIRDSNVPCPPTDIIHMSYDRHCVLDSGAAVSSDVGLGRSAAPAAGTERGHGPATSIRTHGTAESGADIVTRTRRDPFTGWTVTAACTLTGRGEGGILDVLGVPVVGDLDCVAEYMQSCRYSAESEASKFGWSGCRPHQLTWDLEGPGVKLVVDPLNSLASGVG